MNLYPAYISEYLNSQSVKTNIDGQIIGGTQINLIPHLDPETCRLTAKVFQDRSLLLPYQKFEKMDDAVLLGSSQRLAEKIAATKPGINMQELQTKCYNFVSSMRDYARMHDPQKQVGPNVPTPPTPSPPAKKSNLPLIWTGAGVVLLVGLIAIYLARTIGKDNRD